MPGTEWWRSTADIRWRGSREWGRDDGLSVWFWCYHCFVCIFGLWIVGSKGLGLVCCCYCSMFLWCKLFFRFEEDGISWRKWNLSDEGKEMGGGEERGKMEMEKKKEYS